MTEHNPVFAQPRIERVASVLSRIGMSRSWLYAEIARGAFVPPVKIGRASGWDSRAVDAWIEARIECGRPQN